MIKYKASYYWQPKIEKVLVERETVNSVWVKGRREAKATQSHIFLATFEEAKDFLEGVFAEKAETARRRLHEANDTLGRAKALKEEGEEKS